MWRKRRHGNGDLAVVFAWRPPVGWEDAFTSLEEAGVYHEVLWLQDEIDIWVTQPGPREGADRVQFRQKCLAVLEDSHIRSVIGDDWPVWVRAVEGITA